MTSKHRDRSSLKERGSVREGNPTDDREGVNIVVNPVSVFNGTMREGDTSQLIQTTGNNSQQSDRDRKRMIHNEVEKKRKEKIKYWISKIGEILPTITLKERETPSTLEIVEKAYQYIVELRDKNEQLMQTRVDQEEGVSMLNIDLDWDGKKTGSKSDTSSAFLDSSGDNSTEIKSTNNGVSSTTDGTCSGSKEDTSKSKSKNKRRNTISVQLENLKNARSQHEKEVQSQQELITSSVSVPEEMNIIGTAQMGGVHGNQFLGHHNMMYNQVMVTGNNQFMVQGGMQNNMQGNMAHSLGSSMGNTFANSGMSNEKASAETAGTGLLQLAMQDAGITPHSGGHGNHLGEGLSVSAPATPAPELTSEEEQMEGSSPQNSALQTLASVASKTQNMSMAGGMGSSSVPGMSSSQMIQSNALMTCTTQTISSNIPIMSTGHMPAYQQMVHAGNNVYNMQMSVPMNVLQNSGMSGPVQHQQIMFINEQGFPMIATVPVGVDINNPSNANKVNNFSQQHLMKDQQNMDPSNMNNQAMVLAAQQQANLLQNQMMGTNASQFQNIALQQQNMLLQQQQISGQFQGNQFIQSQAQGQGQFQGHFQLQGQHQFQIPGSNGQIPGLMQQNTNLVLPVNQNGSYLALNTMPNQPSQLPSALILPNGQIIPVVSNPQTLTSQTGIINANAQMQQRVGVQQQFQAQFQTGADGTLTQSNSTLMNPNQMIVGQGQAQGQIHIHSVQQGQGQSQGVHQNQMQDQQSMDVLMTTSSANQKTSIVASSSTTNAVSNSSMQNMVMTTQIKSSASQKADAYTVANIHQDTNVTNMMGHGMRNVSSAQGMVTLPSGQLSGTDNPGMQPQPVPQNQTSYQSQAMQQVPTKSTPILITLPVNGQPTSVLVDPTTMQVLGQFQPPVSTQSQIQTSVATNQTGMSSTPTTMPTTASTSSSSSSSKKNKKNNQRTICPKPTTGGSDGTKTSTGSSSSSKKKSKSSIKADKEPAEQPDSVSDGLHIEIPESTMEPDTSTHTTESTSSETDILAKAAESIFSSPNEISPTISGFYNPANEDNPLHIDTSAGETEDDGNASPQKQAMEVERDNNDGQGSNNKQGGNRPEKDSSSFGENNSSDVRNSNSLASSSCDQGINNDDTTKEIGIGKLPDSMTDLFHESQAEDRTLEIHMDMSEDHFMEPAVTSACVETKKNKKSKKPSTNSVSLENQTKPKPEVQQMQDSKGKVTCKKQGTEEIVFPETITFSENELDDVLDRVESAVLDGADGFGTALTDSCESPGTASKSSGGKKSKSKRNRTTADTEQEPPNKKTKQGKDKSSKVSDQTNVKHMSVYDFNGDASDDIGSPLLPLHLSKSSAAPDAPSMPLLVKSSGPEMVLTPESNPQPQHSPSKSQTSSKKSSKSISNSQNKLQSEAGKGVSNSQAKISSEPITTSPLSAPVLSSPKLNRSSAKMTTDNLNPVGTANESPKVTQSSTISYYPTPADKRVASREQSSSSTIVSQTLESITGLNTVTNMDANSSLLSLSMTSMSPTFSTLDDASPPHNSSKSSSNMHVNDTSPRSSLNTHTTPQNPNMVQPNSNNPLNQGMYDSQRDSSGIDSSSQPVSGSSQPSSNSLQSRNTQDSAQTKNNSGITSERGVTEPNILKSPHASFGSPPPNFNSSAGELSSGTTNSLTLPSDYTMTTVAKEASPASSSSNTFNRNNFSSPYSAEMLFTSPAKQGINVKSPHGQSTIATSAKDIRNKSNANSSMPDILKQQNKIYSAENFVHSSQNDILRNQPEPMRGDKRQSANKQLRSVNTDTSDGSFARLQNESSSDAFNFANIGLNLTPIASSGSSYMDSLNLPGSTPVTASANSFSFSLSSATGTTKSTGSSVGHHPFSFYPMLSSVSQPSQFSPSIAMSQSQQPPQMSPGLFRHELNRGDNSHEVSNKPSCSKEKMPSSHGQSSMQEPFSFSMSRSNPSHEHMSHDQNYFSDPQRRQGIADANKNQSDQLRNTQKQLTDVSNSHSRNPSGSQTEKRNVTSMERTPQLHSSNQPYFSPTGFSTSQPMNTPPLHHPPLLSNEENRRTMTNRSPYDSNFTNPSNQGFSSLNLPYGGNRYEGGSMNFNRDSSGTQPLSHTPPNQSSAGRKSANPPSSSENTKSTKQSQSQLPMKPQQHPPVSQGPMSGPVAPSSSSRPTPPNPSLRHTPPQITPPQSVPANQQMPQPRQQKQSSRASKQQKKNNKQLYPEVDSNLSHSIFEPNRSMTPFFPLQNLSPQSRAVQGEGPPFLPGNFFNPGSRLANSNTPMPKTSDISFNQLFQPGRSQNGLGLNFQPGFGMNMNMNMNMNSVHGNHGNGPITPHSGSVGVTPHMGNFSLSNIFSDSASQSESLNISPIKFSHTNPILSHQPGMDPNSLQHHHQGSSLYHNRSHPPTPSMMSINSILGPNPHGFDGRSIGQINTSMAPPFHGHGNPAMFAMPPLNFSMHDH
ncbi:hypothetical protein ACJMK2_025348 [Sinanodonta woodiana]|uniref:BHLH domain-containing protein n=1 Tax=Sinanodonta woodiana TaxID=1069815 RepID=A0ABD3XGQ7_SINWO